MIHSAVRPRSRLGRAIQSARPLYLALALTILPAAAVPAEQNETARLAQRAAQTSIARDTWGIAHVHGSTDADAVFAMIYAQAEDDFPRIEANYLASLGRRAEVEGETALWADLRQRILYDTRRLPALYASSPLWLQDLMRGWADGLNYYLATHPEVKPRAITRFEPWMALSFTEGSIGGDVAKISLSELEAFYGKAPVAVPTDSVAAPAFKEPTGSNGAAIAPSNTRDGHALLLINPHTSFYFRSEAQMTSDAGLNAYGAATWGQFFIYQGFNETAGWMHTTSTLDAVDEFAVEVEDRGGRPFYRYGDEWRPVIEDDLVFHVRAADGTLSERRFRTFRTVHGPIVRSEKGRWIAAAVMDRPIAALEQSFLRTRARDFDEFLDVARLAANSSNNTLFADAKGTTALLLPQFVPRRDDRFDYTRPVDGSNPAAAWKGDTPLAALPQVVDPNSGWIYNANDGPWWAAGADSPQRPAFPRYVDQIGRSARTPQAMRVFGGDKHFTAASLAAAAYDPRLPVFERLIPGLIAAYDAAATPAERDRLKAPVDLLRRWDCRWAAASVETSLAVFWGEALWMQVSPGTTAARSPVYDAMDAASAADKLAALAKAIDRLEKDFGSWRTPWGEINRIQRLDGAIEGHFDDNKPSLPVPFTSAKWGSLASFGAKRSGDSRRLYGWTGNSFVAVVEFGERVRARALMAGGQSGDPASPHFFDQAQLYAKGRFRPVYFHADELIGHVVRRYRPGDRAAHDGTGNSTNGK